MTLCNDSLVRGTQWLSFHSFLFLDTTQDVAVTHQTFHVIHYHLSASLQLKLGFVTNLA